MYAKSDTMKSQVVIAKCDATANDVPDDITGFPTIKMFPADNKSGPFTYSGDRSIADLAEFVAEKGKFKADAFAQSTKDADGDEEMEDAEAAESMGKVAEAATKSASGVAESVAESVKSVVSEATEAAKTMIVDSDEIHDEL